MKRIVKIVENHVEVQTIYFDEKINGKEMIVSRETYGQQRIDNEIKKANDKKTILDTVVIDDEKAKENIKLVELNEIQIEMDK